MGSAANTEAVNGRQDPRWLAVFAKLLNTEGGFVDSPADHGGATKYGLSLRFLAQAGQLHPALVAELDINHDGALDVPDIAGLSIAAAQAVYFDYFWAPAAGQLPQPLDAAVFDQVVNDGQTPAVRMLQQALNAVKPPVLSLYVPLIADGNLGPQTVSRVGLTVGYLGAARVLDAYRAQAAARYNLIVAKSPSQHVFLAGWLRRAAELGDV